MFNEEAPWQPSAHLDDLRLRAKVIAQIRNFFAKRDVLEVETPLLASATVTDPHIQSISANCFNLKNNNTEAMYLQTSPEYGMKRLLAFGSGPIYQICKAFRNDESGRHHNPEFTMLEWYRPGFDHHDLMQEVGELLTCTLHTNPPEFLSYEDAFQKFAKINPHTAAIASLKERASHADLPAIVGLNETKKNDWLDVLFIHLIEPNLGKGAPTFIYDFPVSQAALAKIRQGAVPVAERFEVYIEGVELANGYHELTDEKEQSRRFNEDLVMRQQLGLPQVPIDSYLLKALAHGLPDSAGVALGIDRLVMLAAKKQSIKEVITFPLERA